MSKRDVLRETSFGARVAEDEVRDLTKYFVETEEWRKIYSGSVDVVYGPKGSGKSALYSLLTSRRNDLFDRNNILLVPAENPQGAPAFQGLVADPPTSEREFIGLWKLYLLTLIGQTLRDYGAAGDASRRVITALEEAELLSASANLAGLVRSALRYVRQRLGSFEASISVDPATGLPSVGGKIMLQEPTAIQAERGFVSIDELLRLANQCLTDMPATIWLVLDRLDVAFQETTDLEANALRALFRVYLDLLGLEAVRIKIFLRSDIWKRITSEGFREGSHITRNVTIRWDQASLLNLVLRRTLQNTAIQRSYAVNPGDIIQSTAGQSKFFYRMFPEQVDVGSWQPKTFDWMLTRTRDGSRENAPRELIHLLNSMRDEQLRQLALGSPDPDGETLFSRAAIKGGLPEVSRTRLEQTTYAEYPNLRQPIMLLTGEKTLQLPDSLAGIWGVSREEALERARALVEIGFFELRGTKENPEYWVPFLYRDALNMVQGTAD